MQIASSKKRARSKVTLLVAAGSWLMAAGADAATFTVSGKINGIPEPIGSMTATLSNRVEEGAFTLDAGHKYLMNDAMGCQFRWLQIVTQDPDPINYLGNPLSAPYVDPPKNGWDYQRTPANNHTTGTPGADTSPFYENDDVAGTFAFPKYSGQFNVFAGNNNVPVHEGNNGIVRTQDVPGYGDSSMINTSLLFETYLVFMDADLRANKSINVVWGYSWGVGRNGSGDYYDIGPAELTYDTIQNSHMTTIQNALNADGFSDWTASAGGDLNCLPEPASLALLVLGSLMLARRRCLPAAA